MDGWSGVWILVEARDFLFSKTSRPACGPPKFQFSGYLGSFHGSKMAGAWSHWPPLSAEVKNEYSLLPGLHSMYRDDFPFKFDFTITEAAGKYVSYVVSKYI